MRHLPVVILTAIAWLVPAAHAREQTELRDRIRDGVQRTDKDLGNYVHRDKLDEAQRKKFDAVVEDFDKLRQALAAGKWENERERLERAVDNIDFLAKHAPIEEADRQTLGIDVYTLQVILDAWKAQSTGAPGKN